MGNFISIYIWNWYLWLAPYMQFAVIIFYKYVSGNTQKLKLTAEEPSKDDDKPIKED